MVAYTKPQQRNVQKMRSLVQNRISSCCFKYRLDGTFLNIPRHRYQIQDIGSSSLNLAKISDRFVKLKWLAE